MNLGDEAHILMKKSLGLDVAASTENRDASSAINDEQRQHFYDKNVSFFDRISCEANDKIQKKPVNWKEERKINAETFGVKDSQNRLA